MQKLFSQIAPQHAERNGDHTHITKLGRRSSDAAEPEKKQKKFKKLKEATASAAKSLAWR